VKKYSGNGLITWYKDEEKMDVLVRAGEDVRSSYQRVEEVAAGGWKWAMKAKFTI